MSKWGRLKELVRLEALIASQHEDYDPRNVTAVWLPGESPDIGTRAHEANPEGKNNRKAILEAVELCRKQNFPIPTSLQEAIDGMATAALGHIQTEPTSEMQQAGTQLGQTIRTGLIRTETDHVKTKKARAAKGKPTETRRELLKTVAKLKGWDGSNPLPASEWKTICRAFRATYPKYKTCTPRVHSADAVAIGLRLKQKDRTKN